MPNVLSMPQIGLIVDALYQNAKKPKYEQKSLITIGKDTGTSKVSVAAVRNILQELKLLIIEGERRAQTTCWHPDKCTPNPALLTQVYRIYTKDVQSRVKVKRTKGVKESSLELAVQTLEKLGYHGELIRELPSQGRVLTIQKIVLRKKD